MKELNEQIITWNSVNDKLPEKDVYRCLVCWESFSLPITNHVTIATYFLPRDGYKAEWSLHDLPAQGKISYWASLPDCPSVKDI